MQRPHVTIFCLGLAGAVTAVAQPQPVEIGDLPETTYAWGVLHVYIVQRLIQDTNRQLMAGREAAGVENTLRLTQAVEAALEHVREVLQETGFDINALMGLEDVIDGLMAVEVGRGTFEGQFLALHGTLDRIEQVLVGLLVYVDLGVVERQRAYLVEELRNALEDNAFGAVEPFMQLYLQAGLNFLGEEQVVEEQAGEVLDTQDPLVRVLSGRILPNDDSRNPSKKRRFNGKAPKSCSTEARQFRDFF